MAIIEMIPPEYWAQMRRELNTLNPSELARIAAEAEDEANQPNPPGRPRAPTDGLTPEQIAKREFNRECSARYREQCKEMLRLKISGK